MASGSVSSMASSYEAWTATGMTSGQLTLARFGKMRTLTFNDVVVPSSADLVITAVAASDSPAFVTTGVLVLENTAAAQVWVRVNGTFGTSGAIKGHTINGSLVWIAE